MHVFNNMTSILELIAQAIRKLMKVFEQRAMVKVVFWKINVCVEGTEGFQDIAQPNRPLWCIDYLELKVLEKCQMKGEVCSELLFSTSRQIFQEELNSDRSPVGSFVLQGGLSHCNRGNKKLTPHVDKLSQTSILPIKFNSKQKGKKQKQ